MRVTQAKRFAAEWSMSVCVVTVAVVGWMGREAAGEANHFTASLLVAGAAVLPVLIGITIVFAPLGCLVYPEGVVIHRMGRSLAFGFEQIASARRIGADDVGFVVRVFGSGGLFGWFGRFHGTRLGWFTAYNSNRRDLVLLTLRDGNQIAISPYPPDDFVATVEAGVRQAIHASKVP